METDGKERVGVFLLMSPQFANQRLPAFSLLQVKAKQKLLGMPFVFLPM